MSIVLSHRHLLMGRGLELVVVALLIVRLVDHLVVTTGSKSRARWYHS